MIKSRFGSSHLVAQSVINDLRNWKAVSSAAEVCKFADDLNRGLLHIRFCLKLVHTCTVK